MSNPAIHSSHLVLTLHGQETCAVKKIPQANSVLVIKMKEAAKTLTQAEPNQKDAMLLIDLTSKDDWKSRCLREIDYTTLLVDVMPKLGLPNFILLEREFVALSRTEQKTRVKELCEAVEGVRREMTTFNVVTVKMKYPFTRKKNKRVETTAGRNAEGLSSIALMHKHKLPPGFRLIVIKGTEGIKTYLKFEQKRATQIFKDNSTRDTSTDWLEKMIEQVRALGPALGIGQTEFYETSPSSPNWHSGSESVFQNPKKIDDKPNDFYSF